MKLETIRIVWLKKVMFELTASEDLKGYRTLFQVEM